MKSRILKKDEAIRAVAEALRRIPSAEQREAAAKALAQELSAANKTWSPREALFGLQARGNRDNGPCFNEVAAPHYSITGYGNLTDGRYIEVGQPRSSEHEIAVSCKWDHPDVIQVRIEEAVA